MIAQKHHPAPDPRDELLELHRELRVLANENRALRGQGDRLEAVNASLEQELVAYQADADAYLALPSLQLIWSISSTGVLAIDEAYRHLLHGGTTIEFQRVVNAVLAGLGPDNPCYA